MKIEIIIHAYNLRLKNVFGIKILSNVLKKILNAQKINVNIVNSIVSLIISYGMVMIVMITKQIYQSLSSDVIN